MKLIVIVSLMLQMLQIGVAVGDIEKVERNAYLQKTGLQVTLFHSHRICSIHLLLLSSIQCC